MHEQAGSDRGEAGTLMRLPARARDGHKGTYGSVAVVGGSARVDAVMLGAPALAATAALRAGAGLCRIVAPRGVITQIVALCPSATGVALETDNRGEIIPHEAARTLDDVIERNDVLVVGPGMGESDGVEAAVLRVVQQDRRVAIVDADAINALSRTPEFFRDLHAPAIFTPHPGEFKRLCAGMGLRDGLGIDRSREDACVGMAQRLGRVVVLKGAGTVVSDGLRVWTCSRGHPCLATGGTGDVLAGLLGGLVAQVCPSVEEMAMRARVPQMPADPARPMDLFQAACVGVEAHAIAGERWAKERGASAGLLAMELAEMLPGVLEEMRGGA